MAWFKCMVNEVGPVSDGTETPAPVIYLNLSDEGGTFINTWFFAADSCKLQMLAVALSAISLRLQVEVGGAPPNANNEPVTQIDRLYLINKSPLP